MSNVIHTNFGNIEQIPPSVVAYVNAVVRDATQNSVQQSGPQTVDAVPKYTSATSKTVQSTNIIISEFNDLSVGGGIEIGTTVPGNSYYLPLGRPPIGNQVLNSDGAGNLIFTPESGGVTDFIPTLTVTTLAQGTSNVLKNYVFPSFVPPIDGNTYALTGTNLGASYPDTINISALPPVSFAFDVVSVNPINNYIIQFTLQPQIYTVDRFMELLQLGIDSAIAVHPILFRVILSIQAGPTPRFGFAIINGASGDPATTISSFTSSLSFGSGQGLIVLGGNAGIPQTFLIGTSFFPNVSPNYVAPFVDNTLRWEPIPPQTYIMSDDGSTSIICEEFAIGGGLIASKGNWEFGLGNFQNVGSISSTANTLTSTCGQSQLQLASTADGLSISNTTYLSSGSGLTNTAFATTTDKASILRNGGSGSVIRVSVDADIKLIDQNSTERLLINTASGYTSLRSGNGNADRFDIDGLGAYMSVGSVPVFYVNPSTLDTRIWSPDGSSLLGIENTNGIKINNSYYLPIVAGTQGQVLTQDSGNTSSWQTPQILGFYSQTTPVTVVSTATQTSIIGAGVGSLTVPANYFTDGMAFTYRTGGLFGALNNATLRFRLTNSGTLFDSGLLQFSPAIPSGRPWNCDITFTYIGGTALITNFNYNYNNGSDARGFTSSNTNNTFNTAIINTLNLTAEWGASSASNTITTNYGILTKIF